jgi:thiol:disulfide interchange protein DsbC
MYMRNKLLAGLLLMLAGSMAHGDEAAIRKVMQTTFPKLKVSSIAKTPIAGVYETVVGGHIIYTDENATYFITEGHLWDVKAQRDITAERLDDLSRIDFNSLPLELAVKVVRGNGSRKMAVFSDPDCPFCKKLEQEGLAGLTDVTIYTFLFPIDKLHPDAANKSRIIWCAPDRAKAWNNWVLKGHLAQGNSSCNTPLDKIAALAQKVGVESTPTLFFADGLRLRGAYPADDIEQALDNASKKTK